MIENADIAPGAITEPKLSKNFRLNLTNVEKGADGQIPVVQSDGSMAYKSVGGDATLDSSGNFTVTTSTSSTGETTQGATGATGPAGATGATGAQGATGAAGSDANVTAENVDGALEFTGSTAGLVKRTADNTFALDTSTYSTDGHSHTLSNITDSGTAAALDVPATGDAASGEVVKGSDSRLIDTRTPSSTLAHKASHETGGSDALSPADIGASASGHTHAHADLTSIDANQHIDWTAASAGTVHGTNYTDTTYTSSDFDHDALTNFVDNEHLDWTTDRGLTNIHSGNYTDTTANESITLSGDVSGTGTNAITCTVGDDSHSHSTSTLTGLGDSATKDVGTASDEVAQGNHTHSYSSLTGTPSTFAPSSHAHAHADLTSIDANQHLDWTTDRGATNIHAGNYTDTTANETVTLSGDVTGSGTTAITCAVVDDSHSHSTSTLTGLGDSATKDVGVGSGDVAQGNHTHDGRYYQESEFLNASAGAGDAGKPVKLDAGGHIDTSMINDGDISFVDLDDLPSTFAPSAHSHDAMSSSNSYATGFVPVGSATHSNTYLRKDGTWGTPVDTNTTYTADDGIGLTGSVFSVAAGIGLSEDSAGLSLNLQGVAEATLRVDDDYIVFLDGGATGAGKKESIVDFATALAGDGLTASSGQLRTVIQKYTKDITWGTDIGTEVVFTGTATSSGTLSTETCTINHALGTKYIFISAIEFSSTSILNFVDNAQEQVDMNFGFIVKPTNDNAIELYGDGGVYTGSIFKIAIIG